MKQINRKNALTLIAGLLAVLLCALTACAPEPEPLTEAEIEELREEYPEYNSPPPLVNMFVQQSFERKATMADTYVYVEITSELQYFSKSMEKYMDAQMIEKYQKQGLSTDSTFFEYTAKVLDDSQGLLKSGAAIQLHCPMIFFDSTPPLQVGDRVAVAVTKDKERENAYSFGWTTMYYVTEDGHVLSCVKEIEGDERTGIGVGALLEEVRAVRKAKVSEQSE